MVYKVNKSSRYPFDRNIIVGTTPDVECVFV